MEKIKYECCHADTCFPDYWSGHHLPHCQIAVYPGMTLDDIKSELRSEINQGAIAGNIEPPLCDPGSQYELNDQGYDLLLSAVDAIEPAGPDRETFFNDIETSDDDAADLVYAFFVFREIEQ